MTHNDCLQYLGDLGCEPVVYKNDEKSVQEIKALNPAGILVSPGPGMAHQFIAGKLLAERLRHAGLLTRTGSWYGTCAPPFAVPDISCQAAATLILATLEIVQHYCAL